MAEEKEVPLTPEQIKYRYENDKRFSARQFDEDAKHLPRDESERPYKYLKSTVEAYLDNPGQYVPSKVTVDVRGIPQKSGGANKHLYFGLMDLPLSVSPDQFADIMGSDLQYHRQGLWETGLVVSRFAARKLRLLRPYNTHWTIESTAAG